MGSFDSAKRLAGESPPFAQDDKSEEIELSTDLDVFRAFVQAGRRLADIHVHYEQQPEYPLTKREKPGEKLDYRVTKMKLSKDKTTLTYNQFLTLTDIPPETYEYRLGNAPPWNGSSTSTRFRPTKRSGITNDPNREDDPKYILRLIGQVVSVSLETVKIVRSLPALGVQKSRRGTQDTEGGWSNPRLASKKRTRTWATSPAPKGV